MTNTNFDDCVKLSISYYADNMHLYQNTYEFVLKHYLNDSATTFDKLKTNEQRRFIALLLKDAINDVNVYDDYMTEHALFDLISAKPRKSKLKKLFLNWLQDTQSVAAQITFLNELEKHILSEMHELMDEAYDEFVWYINNEMLNEHNNVLRMRNDNSCV